MDAPSQSSIHSQTFFNQIKAKQAHSIQNCMRQKVHQTKLITIKSNPHLNQKEATIIAKQKQKSYQAQLNDVQEDGFNSKLVAFTQKVTQNHFIQKASIKNKNITVKQNEDTAVQQLYECQICLVKVSLIMSVGDCEHKYCIICIFQHLQTKIQLMEDIKCPSENCQQLFNQNSTVYNQLNPQQKIKYAKIKNYQKLKQNQKLRMCKFQKCSGFYSIQNQQISECTICRSKYCIKCHMLVHENQCKKEQFLKILKLSQCDHCKTVIQKRDRCNHITCICRYQFCYLCGCKWNKNHLCPNQPPIQPRLRRLPDRGCIWCGCYCCQGYQCPSCCQPCVSTCETNTLKLISGIISFLIQPLLLILFLVTIIPLAFILLTLQLILVAIFCFITGISVWAVGLCCQREKDKQQWSNMTIISLILPCVGMALGVYNIFLQFWVPITKDHCMLIFQCIQNNLGYFFSYNNSETQGQ